MDRLLRWLAIPIHALMWLGIVAGFLMMMHVTADVAGRTVFNHPLSGTTEIVSAYYMVATAYVPWAWIAARDAHIRVELFTRFASPGFTAWLDTVVHVLTAIYVGFFAWETWIRAGEQMAANKSWQAGSAYIPIWPSRWLLPVAGGLMVIYLVLRVIRDVRRRLASDGTREGAAS